MSEGGDPQERTTPPASWRDERGSRLRSEVAALWEKHRAATLDRVAVLEAAAAAQLEGRSDPELRRKAEREAHKLAGSVGTFGYRRASEIARRVEELVAAPHAGGDEEAARLSRLVLALRRELEG